MRAVMKDFGLTEAWKRVPLKELGEWSGGGTPSKAKPEYWEKGEIPWVSPKDMKTERITDSEDHITETAIEESTAKLISAGSVLIVTRSGILSHTLPVAVTTVPVTVNQDLKALTPKEGILPEYVAWALRSFARDILNTCSKQGTTVNSIETAALNRFEIPVAPLDQQKHIVAEIEKQFSRLDEAVANLKRVKANLKRYKAAVLKAAVEGRLVETEAELARKKSPSPLALIFTLIFATHKGRHV
jgi:type I restriction enzyme, S subunit